MKASDVESGLSAERLRDLLTYDPKTGDFTWRDLGFGRRPDRRAGCASKSRGYILVRIDKRLYFAHRLAWLYMTGEWPENQIDHKNNDRADNRWRNLRHATPSQNGQNRPGRRNSRTGVRGVIPAGSRFEARVSVHGKLIRLGYFDSKAAAGAAYRAACSAHYGEFARFE